jgi:hypothetical protein
LLAVVTFICPNMYIRVEGCLPKTATEGDGEVYYSVSCLACRQTHLVHSKTGRVLDVSASRDGSA